MPAVNIWVPGIPKPAGSKRGFVVGKKNAEGEFIGKPRAVVSDANPNAASWKTEVKNAACKAYTDAPHREPCELSFIFTRTRPKAHYNSKGEVKFRFMAAKVTSRPDVLKLARGTEDALTGIVFVDDSQVYMMKLVKKYGDTPGAAIEIAW